MDWELSGVQRPLKNESKTILIDCSIGMSIVTIVKMNGRLLWRSSFDPGISDGQNDPSAKRLRFLRSDERLWIISTKWEPTNAG